MSKKWLNFYFLLLIADSEILYYAKCNNSKAANASKTIQVMDETCIECIENLVGREVCALVYDEIVGHRSHTFKTNCMKIRYQCLHNIGKDTSISWSNMVLYEQSSEQCPLSLI